MKNELEDFIQQHRAALDNKEVPSHAWANIQQRLFEKQPWLQPIRYWQAAAILFFTLSVGLWWQSKPVGGQNAVREFSDAEAFYNQEISEKIKLINNTHQDLNGFTRDFQQLEAMYMVLKEEMAQQPSEKVKEALVLNLLVRINLLNKQLQEIDEANRKTTTVEEKKQS
jgi:hypothetical protein